MEIHTTEIEAVFASVCGPLHLSKMPTNESAAREARRRLVQNPHDYDAIHVLAASSLVHRRPDESLEILASVPGLLHHDATGNRLAGYAWLAQHHDNLARHCFDQAVRLDPHQSDCWIWLGRMAEKSGQEEGAIHYYERAILFDIDGDIPALALSSLHARRRNLKNAIHTLRVCLLRNRRSAKLNLALAKLLKQRARVLARNMNRRGQQRLLDEALECYQIANASSPNVRSLVDQGLLQQKRGQHEDAIRSFEKAVARDGKSSAALNHLANAYVDQGNIPAAIGKFEVALSLDPGHAHSHFRYTRAKKFKPSRETNCYIEQLRNQLAIPDHPRQKQIYFHFAIAKVLDDVGQFDEAWKNYDQANRLKRTHSQTVPAVPIKTDMRRTRPLRPVDDTTRFFSAEYFASKPEHGSLSDTPVFIVGMPRSGTTLTEQILSSHSRIAGAGELSSIDQIRQEMIFREKQRTQNKVGQSLSSNYPALLEHISGQEIQEHAQQYLAKLNAFRSSEVRVTDKMPTNFLHLGLIATLFPNATVIHCRRHPMDVLVSCYCQNLNAPFCDLDQLVNYHRNYRQMMKHWENALPMNIHTVDYESLVADPETESRRLIHHCGLHWEENCLSFHTSDRAVHTPSKWQVRQPMYSTSLHKWRRFEKQLAPIASQIEAEMQDEEWMDSLR